MSSKLVIRRVTGLNIKKALNGIESFTCATFLAAMLIILTGQVVLRWFGASNAWSEEVSRYLFVWVVFLGSSMAIQTGSHIAISTAVKIWPKRIRPYMEIVGTISWMILSAIITYIATDFAVRLYSMGTISLGLQINSGIPFSGVAIGYFFMTIRLIQYQLIPQIKEVLMKKSEKVVSV